MPTNQALPVFYGTLLLILIILGVWMREQLLLRDILTRLGALTATVDAIKDALTGVRERLAALEARGNIFHG